MKPAGKSLVLTFLPLAFLLALSSLAFGPLILEGREPSLLLFAVINFAGYLFFLLMPVELFIPFFLSAGSHPFLLFLLAILTALAAITVDYWIGRLVPFERVKVLVSERRRQRYHHLLERWGDYLVLFFAATPLSSPLLALVAGIIRWPFPRLLAYNAAGAFLKYAIIIILWRFQ